MTTGGGRPPRKGSGPNRRGGGPKQRGGNPSPRGAPTKQKRRHFPSVQITVACDDGDLDRLTTKYRVLELESTAGAPLTERTLRNLSIGRPTDSKSMSAPIGS